MMNMNNYGKSRLYIIVRPIVNVLFRLIYRPTIIGSENLKNVDGLILAGNHTSILDCLLLMSSTKDEIHFLAKAELFKGLKGIIFSHMGLIPVDRSRKNPEALRCAKKYLDNNGVVLIFPEGTTEKGRGLMEFKVGAVKLAHDTDKKIVPFVIEGKYKILKRSVKITFLKPYHVKKEIDKENAILRNKINDILKENNI